MKAPKGWRQLVGALAVGLLLLLGVGLLSQGGYWIIGGLASMAGVGALLRRAGF